MRTRPSCGLAVGLAGGVNLDAGRACSPAIPCSTDASQGRVQPDVVEQLVDQARSEAPQDEVLGVSDEEPGTAVADRVHDGHAVLRVEQLLDRHAEHGVDLAGSTTSTRSAPPTSPARRSRRSCSAAARARAAWRTPPLRQRRARSPPPLRAGQPRWVRRRCRRWTRRGRTTWPGWERMSCARSVNSRSGPRGPSPKSIRTAPRRASDSGGGTKRLMSSAVIVRAPSRIGTSQSGRSSQCRLQVSFGPASRAGDRGDLDVSRGRRPCPRVEQDQPRQPLVAHHLPAGVDHAAGRSPRSRARRRLPGRARGRASRCRARRPRRTSWRKPGSSAARGGRVRTSSPRG